MAKNIVDRITQKSESYWVTFKQGVSAGLGWAIGVTLGLLLISILAGFLLRGAGAIPFVGSIVADIVEVTQTELNRKNPLLQQGN